MKHTAVQPPGGDYVFRLDSLGDGYTEAHIRERLAAARRGEPYELPSPPSALTIPLVLPIPQVKKRYTVRGGAVPRQPRRKVRGFRALYLRSFTPQRYGRARKTA